MGGVTTGGANAIASSAGLQLAMPKFKKSANVQEAENGWIVFVNKGAPHWGQQTHVASDLDEVRVILDNYFNEAQESISKSEVIDSAQPTAGQA